MGNKNTFNPRSRPPGTKSKSILVLETWVRTFNLAPMTHWNAECCVAWEMGILPSFLAWSYIFVNVLD
jgi:hypothetical protein